MRGSEAIQIIGSKLYRDFDISKEPRTTIYKTVYEKFLRRLEDYNSEKGLLLVGSIGVGKTAIMRIMQKLFKDSKSAFRWVNSYDLCDMVEESSVSEIKEIYGKSFLMDLYIDDIGIGNGTLQKYGNRINIISEVLIERYELFVESGIKTHLSSNLPTRIDKKKYPNVQTLEDLYGNRITDRINEMCENIIWKGESLRK
jgi:DNA replication protein DnaC